MSEGAPKDVTKTGEEPTKIIEIGGKKFEVGPNLGKFRWYIISEELDKLNKTLKSNEKSWRIFTKEEYEELDKQSRAIENQEELSDTERQAKFDEYITGLGFASDRVYWSSTDSVVSKDCAYHWDARGVYRGNDKLQELYVQAVREV